MVVPYNYTVNDATRLREAYIMIRDIARVSRLFQQDSVFCGGITFQQFTILDLVRDAGGEIALADVHGLLSVEKSTTTRLVEPLVERGLLARAASSSDARAVRLVLTSAGQVAHGEYWTCIAGRIRGAIKGISTKQFEAVKAALRLFVSAVGAASGDECCR